tara:strand:- start:61 stop:330 length:270 start_codon:yes stop_codon:yes gene_type:complete
VERSDFPIEVQEAFMMHDLLSDIWEGMNGTYLGKDYAPLQTFLDIYEITDRKTTVWFLKHIDYHHSKLINDKQEQKRKAQERKLKSTRK